MIPCLAGRQVNFVLADEHKRWRYYSLFNSQSLSQSFSESCFTTSQFPIKTNHISFFQSLGKISSKFYSLAKIICNKKNLIHFLINTLIIYIIKVNLILYLYYF